MPVDQFGRPLPYPNRTARPAVDPNDLLATAIADQDAAAAAMRPDLGIGAQPPRDPYMANLPPRRDAATQEAITRLQPGRTQAFSGRDAQALQTLDPRALDEARSAASLDQPKTITGSFGGRSFEMTPAARVDRNVLAQIYNKYLQKQGEERQDTVRGSEQAHKERIVTIPGQQATDRAKIQAEAAANEAKAAREFTRPEQEARIAASQAQTAGATAEAGRKAQEFAERVTPQQKAIDDALAAARNSPFAQTPAGRTAIMELEKRSSLGKQLPPDAAAAVAEGTNQPQDIGTIAAEVMADPGINALIARAKETEPGMFTGSRGRQTGAAARILAERAIRARLQRAGASPDEAQALITSILGTSDAAPGASAGGVATRIAQAAGGGHLPIGLIGSLSR